jgi:hypothetical protein
MIETYLMLDAHDLSGPASFEYFVKELGMSFNTIVDGTDRPAQPMSTPRMVAFPEPVGPRRAYLFPFSDQVLYPIPMGARTVVTRLALNPRWLGWWLSTAVMFRATRFLKSNIVKLVLSSLKREDGANAGASFALRVDVGYGAKARHAILFGHTQANAAAAGATEVGRLLLDGAISKPGAWMPEQVVEPVLFLSRLEANDLKVVIASEARMADAAGAIDASIL